ncbi:DUF1501 domain-containing protein, partial [Jatrophihabitans endophyticus]|uniref:DUF1501 domain-containing protein n=1 Tax=Jatrophihabitans endophyticus TaxID=1206085 RepID=UPI0019E80829
PSTDDRTLVVVFLRGAADGLHVLVPATSALGVDYLNTVRPNLMPGDSGLTALSGTSGWALNSKLQPLVDDLWGTGELAFVPAVSAGGISCSHFQAQQWLEHGGSDTASSGWLDRTLELMGKGTTFRAVAQGDTTPISLLGPSRDITLDSLSDFVFPGWDGMKTQSQAAVSALYRGMSGTLGEDVPTTMDALKTAAAITAGTSDSASYPSGDFASALKNLAAILRAEVGLQVATVDVGGWDTHTSEVSELDPNLASTAAALKAFMDDLGPTRRSRVTVVVMTEFGRRVEMNASGGTDHGHGSVMWLLGGGLAGSNVYGKWDKLTASTLDDGNVRGLNNPFDVLGELVQKRLGVGSLSSVFPGHKLTPLGLAAAT